MADSQLLPQLAPYLGQAATGCYPPTGTIASGLATWAASTSLHFAADTLINPVLTLANFGVDAAYAETSPGAGTATVFIEYPIGTTPKLADAGLNAAMGTGLTDLTFTGVVIPDKAPILVHILQINAGGVTYINRNKYNSFGPRTGFVSGTGTPPDWSNGPLFVARAFQGRQSFAPIAIRTMTRKRSVLILGTSKEVGLQDQWSDLSGEYGTITRILAKAGIGFINTAVASSSLLAWLAASKPNLTTLMGYCSDVWDCFAINDILAGKTAQNIAGMRRQAAATAPTKRWTGVTIPPNTAFSATSTSITSITAANATSVSISALSRVGRVATATVASTVGLKVNQTVNLSGASQTGYNGVKSILSISSDTTFTFAVDDLTVTPATGTISMIPNRVATATVAATAAMTTGQTVNIVGVTGASNDAFNGAKVITVATGTTFTYTVPCDMQTSAVPGTLSWNDAFSTLAGQTPGTNGLRVMELNDLIRAGIDGETAVFDLSDLTDPLRTGKWPVSRDPAAVTGTPGFSTLDGLHESQAINEINRDRGAALAKLLLA